MKAERSIREVQLKRKYNRGEMKQKWRLEREMMNENTVPNSMTCSFGNGAVSGPWNYSLMLES